jgi:hypothetical protein
MMKLKEAISTWAYKEKEAGKLGAATEKIKKVLDAHPVAKGFAIYGMGLPAIYAASSSAVKGISNAYNAAMKGHRMNKMMDVYPDLKDEDQNKVRLAFNTINKLNPNFASDPLIAGTWVKRVLDSDVGGGIAVDPHSAGQISKGRDGLDVANMITRGAETAINKAPDTSSIGGDMPSMEDLNEDLYHESLRDYGENRGKAGGVGNPEEAWAKMLRRK